MKSTSKEKLLLMLNELFTHIEPINYKSFNKIFKTKDKKRMELFEKKYPELVVGNKINKDYGMTTMTIINTIVNCLCDDKIYITLNEEGNLTKFGWVSEYKDKTKKVVEMTEKIYDMFPDCKIKFKTDGTYVDGTKIEVKEYTLNELLLSATPEMLKIENLDAVDVWYMEKVTAIKKYLEGVA